MTIGFDPFAGGADKKRRRFIDADPDAMPEGGTEEMVEAIASRLTLFSTNPDAAKLPAVRRQALRELRRMLEAERPKETGAKRFTTKYAIDYGSRRGWKLMDRERWNPWGRGGKGSHEDVAFAADAIFLTPGGRTVAIQGAGRHERTEHRAKFDELRGVEKCLEFNVEFLYLEFVRGNKEPVLLERWVE